MLDSEAATGALGKYKVNILGTQGKLGLTEWGWRFLETRKRPSVAVSGAAITESFDIF